MLLEFIALRSATEDRFAFVVIPKNNSSIEYRYSDWNAGATAFQNPASWILHISAGGPRCSDMEYKAPFLNSEDEIYFQPSISLRTKYRRNNLATGRFFLHSINFYL